MIEAILLAIETEEEKEAVSEILERYYRRMTARANRILHNIEDAQDAAMNVIQKIADKPQGYLEYKDPQIIHKILHMTRNEAIDIYRKNNNKSNLIFSTDDFEDYADSENVWDGVITEETIELIKEAIKELDEKYRSVFMMSYFDRMKNYEIAEALGLEKSNVNVILFRAKKMLRDNLLKKGYVR